MNDATLSTWLLMILRPHFILSLLQHHPLTHILVSLLIRQLSNVLTVFYQSSLLYNFSFTVSIAILHTSYLLWFFFPLPSIASGSHWILHTWFKLNWLFYFNILINSTWRCCLFDWKNQTILYSGDWRNWLRPAFLVCTRPLISQKFRNQVLGIRDVILRLNSNNEKESTVNVKHLWECFSFIILIRFLCPLFQTIYLCFQIKYSRLLSQVKHLTFFTGCSTRPSSAAELHSH